MARSTLTEEEAKILFARQLDALRREGAAQDSESRLAAIFSKNEEDCRELEIRLEMQERRVKASPSR